MNGHPSLDHCSAGSAEQNGHEHDDQGTCAEVALTVEVCQSPTSSAVPEMIADRVNQYLSNRSFMYQNEVIPVPEEDPFLHTHVESIRVCDTDTDREAALGTRLLFWQVHIFCTTYPLARLWKHFKIHFFFLPHHSIYIPTSCY